MGATPSDGYMISQPLSSPPPLYRWGQPHQTLYLVSAIGKLKPRALCVQHCGSICLASACVCGGAGICHGCIVKMLPPLQSCILTAVITYKSLGCYVMLRDHWCMFFSVYHACISAYCVPTRRVGHVNLRSIGFGLLDLVSKAKRGNSVVAVLG